MGILVESNVPSLLKERWLGDERELLDLVRRFRACTIGRDEWTHRAHVGVASALVLTEGPTEALHLMKQTIPRLNERQGALNSEVSGYHETLTVFWVCFLGQFLERVPGDWSNLNKARAAVEAFGGLRRLDKLFYSYDVLACPRARRFWVPPEPVPGWLSDGECAHR